MKFDVLVEVFIEFVVEISEGKVEWEFVVVVLNEFVSLVVVWSDDCWWSFVG